MLQNGIYGQRRTGAVVWCVLAVWCYPGFAFLPPQAHILSLLTASQLHCSAEECLWPIYTQINK